MCPEIKDTNCFSNYAGQMVVKPQKEGKWNDVSVWIVHLKHSKQIK